MGKPKRPMRRSSLIGPWGVGAIVPFPNDESLMITGLDMWRYGNARDFLIKDERLVKRLGASELRWPPDYRDDGPDIKNKHLTIPAVRFPRWHYCPFCGSMQKTTFYQNQPKCDAYQWITGRKCNPNSKYQRAMIPERFIVICPEGHIDDFPVAEWVHSNSGKAYNEHTCRIRRTTGGASSALSGIFYECTCGVKKSFNGAMNPKALSRIGYTCRGSKPWFGKDSDDEKPCGSEEVRVVLRGATNVWFAETVSSICIPIEINVESKRIYDIVKEHRDTILSSLVDGKINRMIVNMIASMKKVDPDLLYQAFEDSQSSGEVEIPVTENMPEDDYRLAEYNVLCKTSGSDVEDFYSENINIKSYDPAIHKYFKSISLVHKLKETRAMVGFSRVEPKDINISECKKLLREGTENWLPAIQVQGEGIFFEFNSVELKKWAKNPKVVNRLKNLQAAFEKSWLSRGCSGILKPEYVLIHTFAHLIINQLSFECGYGSSSIRERIYCEKTNDKLGMYGVLIYTASGDSEGSLGGLVRQGKPGHIEDMVIDAIKNASWCSSDPVCIQSLGQGPDSCNLAACHNCAILPETCCEAGNRLLDRGVVVGTLDTEDIGFFSSLRSEY